MSRTPTAQQAACITAVLNPMTKKMKVKACAGSGKTSLLVMMAEAKVAPSIYLCFNKANADEAKGRFPRHVQCATGHSVAFHVTGKAIFHKTKRPAPTPQRRYVNVAGTPAEVAIYYRLDAIQFDDETMVPARWLGQLVKETVAAFEQSADFDLDIKHVPTAALRKKLHDNWEHITTVQRTAFRWAKRFWADRIDPASPVMCSHDTYLKLYQLLKPVISKDVIYVDEFQDTTPCMLDIIMRQAEHAQIVMVGDPRQAIYGWRGAVNAMQMVQCDEYPLTKSFRYGQAIADVATQVLEGDLRITGHDVLDSKAEFSGLVDRTKPHARLFRTNMELLFAAVQAIEEGLSVCIETDVRDFVKLLQSALGLFNNVMKDVKHEALVPYESWEALLEDAKDDPALGRLVKIVSEGHATKWVELLETHVNPSNPLVTFTTAHKSKGREFEQVIVESDFKSGKDEKGNWIGLTFEEQNLLYVACTRAIMMLEYNMTALEYVRRNRGLVRRASNDATLALAA